jgi:hypothetical protein
MSKATLIYEIPEERELFDHALKGASYYGAISRIVDLLRSKIKYSSITDEQETVLQEIRKDVHEILEDYDVEL